MAAIFPGVRRRGRASGAVDASAPGPIQIELVAPASVASVAAPPRREAGPVARKVARRRGHGPPRRRATETPIPAPPLGPNPLEPPPFQDPAAATSVARGAAPSAATRAAPPPTPPSQTLSAADATYLRIYDTYPRLPASLLVVGRTYAEFIELCVDTAGRVSSVDISRGTTPELDELLRAAVRTWRYRPYVVAGAPRSFCHHMIIHFDVE